MPEKMTEQTLVGDILHEWTVQEYEQHADRSRLWYFLVIVLGLGLVIYGMVTGNFLFALIIILSAIILFLQTYQSPPQVMFQITELGIILGSRFFPYTEIENFYIVYNPPEVKTLYLEPKGVWKPRIMIPLLDTNPVEVKHTLREFLAEDLEKEEEPLSDRAARNWRIH